MKAADFGKGYKIHEVYVGNVVYVIRGFHDTGKCYLYHLDEYDEHIIPDFYGEKSECEEMLTKLLFHYLEGRF